MTLAASESSTESPASEQNSSRWKPLRIWPAAILIAGMVFFRFLPQMVEDGPASIWMSAAFGPALCGLVILAWWLTLSRARWFERIIGFLGTIVGAAVSLACVDPSMMGPAIPVLVIPLGTAGFALGAILCSSMLSIKRTAVAILLACIGFGASTTLRSEGMWGNYALGLFWRWTPSNEERLVSNESSRRNADLKNAIVADAFDHPEWPCFRGSECDGRQHGTKVSLDWTSSPPEKVWKITVGPGWSSFAVAGNWLFTQEQRGTMETVACYAADSGREVWTRQIESRFDDPLGGPGPRATPTIAGGYLFAMYATGFVLCLDPATGNEIWKSDIREIANRQPPTWGFSSSPLVTDTVVIVHAGGAGDKGVLALNKETGKLQWSVASGDHTYSSPQLANLMGEQVVLMLTNTGLNILDPATGSERLNYDWSFDGYRALQPQVIDSDSILLPSAMGAGTRKIRVSKSDDKLKAEEVWTSRNLKPEFNDLVVYQGHAYGFDSAIFTCVDLATGKRDWKGGRYGKGQVLLLEDSAALLVIGEQGEVVLLKADPKEHTELGKFQAIEGKTWNHPVVVGDKLYIRNSQEAACYRLPLAAPTAPAAP